jgi:hypothetical protein
MATNHLQSESAQAKPLTLWDAGMKLEDIEVSADELAALIYTAARDDQLDPETRSALRAIGKLAAHLGCDLVELREAVYAASRAERGGNVAEFPARD